MTAYILTFIVGACFGAGMMSILIVGARSEEEMNRLRREAEAEARHGRKSVPHGHADKH